MKQIIEKVCTAKLFEFIIQNNRKLNMEILSGIYPTGTPAVEIIGHLCNYINSFKMVERNEDVKAICDLTTQLNGLRECYKVLESKYTETLKELSESRKKQIDQSAVNNELSILTKKQEFEIQELKRQIYIKGLINSQGMEIFPPDR
jgi:hypothetical protein